ncbi:MAG: hypothetical protein JST04_03450 [Bdellovibrionales bacterium]|nr:hypothetical protein [Bdellovibrionales bacterium]
MRPKTTVREVSRWVSKPLLGALALGVGLCALEPASAAEPPANPSAPTATVAVPADYAFGFRRSTRVAGEFHRSLGSSIAQKRQGTGVGLAIFFPLTDSNFDLGVRYVYIHEARNVMPDEASAFTLLTFVFDYYVWPTKVGGLFVGGEIGVTDPAAHDFFSVYSDYAFVGKFGYEYTFRDSRWSATFEARRAVRDDSPLKATRESHLYTNSIAFGVRYRL